MKNLIHESSHTDTNEIFNIHFIDHEVYNKTDICGNILPPQEDCIFFVGHDTILDRTENLLNWLDNFFKFNSFLVLNQRMEPSMRLRKSLLKNLGAIKKYKNRIIIFYTGDMSNDSEIFKNTRDLNLIKRCNSELFYQAPDLWIPDHIKNQKIIRENKFLLTTVLKPARLHRHVLKEELYKHRDLLKYHLGNIHTPDYTQDSWVGDTSSVHGVYQHTVSWDLYKRASFEIVPEACYDFVSWLTEKTLKPFMAKIPFLILSNVEFYNHLKDLGFKTFDTLIDESFAYEQNLEFRVKKLVQTTDYIIQNDALKFYEAAQEICEHNFNQYLYLSAKEKYDSFTNLANFKDYINNINS